MIHLLGLPHTQFDADKYSACAFTAKAVRLARMLRSRGHEVTVYWGGYMGDVCLMTELEQEEYFGPWSPDNLPVIEWDSRLEYWKTFHARALIELNKNMVSGDILAIVGGAISQEIVDIFKDRFTVIEPGVGYEGICKDTFCCFESYAWMHNRYGANWIGDGRSFDTVIPNAVYPDEWSMASSEGYALFVGRLIWRKGIAVATQIANEAGLKLIMAGGGVKEKSEGRILATDGTLIQGNVEHIGAITGEKRRQIFAGAEIFICPTLYIGPWEGVHAEAMMSGVGVAAPDYGVFTETLPKEYRYRNLKQAVKAAKLARETRGSFWRDRSIPMFGAEACADMYDEWLDRLYSLRDGRNGWYG